jgi:hypothetical protein
MGIQRACPRKRKVISGRNNGQQRIPSTARTGLDPGPDLFLDHSGLWSKSADATSDRLPPLDFSRRSALPPGLALLRCRLWTAGPNPRNSRRETIFVSRYHTLISPFRAEWRCCLHFESVDSPLPLAFRQRQFAPIFGACYNCVLSSVDVDHQHLNAARPFRLSKTEQASQEHACTAPRSLNERSTHQRENYTRNPASYTSKTVTRGIHSPPPQWPHHQPPKNPPQLLPRQTQTRPRAPG